MKSLKDVHKDVRDVLYGWNYEPTDIVHTTDIAYAIYHSIGEMSCTCRWHAVCLCLNGDLTDYGNGLYGINEESTA